MTLPPVSTPPKGKKRSKSKKSAGTSSTASTVVVRALPVSALRPNKTVLENHRKLLKALHGSAPTKIPVPRSWNGKDGIRAFAAELKAGLPPVGSKRP